MSFTALLAAGAASAIAYVGYREHRHAQRARRGLLDECASALERPRLTHGADQFPHLEGFAQGRRVRVDLAPDTLTIRRLPQLWLNATLLDDNPRLPGLAVLVRPAGTEFYSLTSRFPERFETPAGFPAEVLIRGEHGADHLLHELREPMAAILADGRVKEIAVTSRGVRIIRQAAEGKRGEHLLLRQSVFEDAAVPHRDLKTIIAQLQALRAVTTAYGRARAA